MFNPALLVKLQPSSLFTDPATIPNIAVSPLVPQSWLYNSNGDNLATVMASGYFNVFANWTNTLEYNNGQFFRVGDTIYVVASDVNAQIQIASLNPTTTTSLPPGPLSITNGDIAANAAIAFSKLAALPSTYILVGSVGNVATAVAMTGNVTISNTGVTTIAAGAVLTTNLAANSVTLAKLASGIAPSHIVKFAAKYTTTGGAAAEAITIAGVASTDLPFIQLVSPGSNTVTVSYAVPTTNTLTVTFSANPGSDAIINYQILRAAS